MYPQWLFCCLGIAPRVQLLKKIAWLLHIIGDKVPQAARDSTEVECSLNRRFYPHAKNDRHSLCLCSSQSWSVGLAIQDEAVNVIYLPFHLGISLGQAFNLSTIACGLRDLVTNNVKQPGDLLEQLSFA